MERKPLKRSAYNKALSPTSSSSSSALPNSSSSSFKTILLYLGLTAVLIFILATFAYNVGVHHQKSTSITPATGSAHSKQILSNASTISSLLRPSEKIAIGKLNPVVRAEETATVKPSTSQRQVEFPALTAPPVVFYAIFSTDCSEFQDWQTILLFHSALVVHQQGILVRIATGCDDNKKSKLKELYSKLFDPSKFMVHFTPAFEMKCKL
jgi:hypothetical protein